MKFGSFSEPLIRYQKRYSVASIAVKGAQLIRGVSASWTGYA